MTSDDRKILKKLAASSTNEDLQQLAEDEEEPHGFPSNEDLVKRKSLQKIFSYLVGAMNSAFPDYDFR
jgi:hypothetical protein